SRLMCHFWLYLGLIPNGEGETSVGATGTSVGRRSAGARNGSKVEMRGGIDGIAGPDFFAILVEDDPFAVADAVGARKHFVMAIRPSSGKDAWGVAQ
ncbi:hypothetical protein, partial [Cupriavidus sp. SK-3]|uniref:hypothetical protein n=1 Tax=Cupriavidus sp. SK-3 TaxID=1470558 RepID=UPI001F1B37BB